MEPRSTCGGAAGAGTGMSVQRRAERRWVVKLGLWGALYVMEFKDAAKSTT